MKSPKIAPIALLFFSAVAGAQVYPNPIMRWGVPSRSITITHYFYDSERDAASRAMSTWNAVGPGFRYISGGFNSYHPSGAANNRPCDSQSGIGEAFDVSTATTAAEARVCVATGTSIITDGDVWVNQSMLTGGSFHSGLAAAPSNKYDFETEILHELGHVLRLLHDNYSTSVVMHPTVSLGQTKRALHARDRAGKITLYP